MAREGVRAAASADCTHMERLSSSFAPRGPDSASAAATTSQPFCPHTGPPPKTKRTLERKKMNMPVEVNHPSTKIETLC